MKPLPCIFDIRRYSVNDGPGIRTTIFFKGCTLHCAWCHNPESINTKPEKLFAENKCIACRLCMKTCTENAISFTDQIISTNRDRCIVCGKCAEVCPSRASEICGKTIPTDELFEVIKKDLPFYLQSGGGVTFSGGEPLIHADYLKDIISKCKQEGIHTTIDTAGNIKTETITGLAKITDLFLYDLKVMNEEVHKKWTGSSNKLILNNLCELSATGARIIIRMPLIAGINDAVDDIQSAARFILALPVLPEIIQLLPYHNIAGHKLNKLGKTDDFQGFMPPPASSIQRALGIFKHYGIPAEAGA